MRRLVLLLVFLSVPAYSQWRSGGQTLPDEPWRKAKGVFGAMLLLSDRAEEAKAEWSRSGMPKITTTDVAARGKPIEALVFFVGCKAVQGKCNTTVDFRVLSPNGSEYGSQAGAELWKDTAAPGSNIQLGKASLGIRIEPQDPPGKYIVRAVAHDINAGLDVLVEQVFRVAP